MDERSEQCIDFDISYQGRRTLEERQGVVRNFSCRGNRISSLAQGPREVEGDYDCSRNNLLSLKGLPAVIKGNLDCSHNEIRSVDCDTLSLNGVMLLQENNITSLQGIHERVKSASAVYATGNSIQSHVMGVFLIRGCRALYIDNKRVSRIVNEYLHMGRAGLLHCQLDLIDAGFDEFAQI